MRGSDSRLQRTCGAAAGTPVVDGSWSTRLKKLFMDGSSGMWPSMSVESFCAHTPGV